MIFNLAFICKIIKQDLNIGRNILDRFVILNHGAGEFMYRGSFMFVFGGKLWIYLRISEQVIKIFVFTCLY